MGFLNKIHHKLEHGLRKIGLPKSIAFHQSRLLTGDAPGVLRRLQRSHRLGHTAAPSFSESNQITKAYNRLMTSVGDHAVRAIARNSNSASNLRSQTRMPSSTSQRLDYNYRRLSDIT